MHGWWNNNENDKSKNKFVHTHTYASIVRVRRFLEELKKKATITTTTKIIYKIYDERMNEEKMIDRTNIYIYIYISLVLVLVFSCERSTLYIHQLFGLIFLVFFFHFLVVVLFSSSFFSSCRPLLIINYANCPFFSPSFYPPTQITTTKK